MMSWFFESKGATKAADGALVLIPDTSGRTYAGFHSGASLRLVANPGQTVGAVLDKFNAFRGPDEQITALYARNGAQLSFSTVIEGTLEGILSRKS